MIIEGEIIGSAFVGIVIENFCQVPVEIQHGPGARGLAGFDEELVRPCLLFDLLIDEPVEHHLRGIILLRERSFIGGVDAGGVRALKVVSGLRHFDEILESDLRGGDGSKGWNDAAIGKMFQNFAGVILFLLRLLVKEFRETAVKMDVAPVGHGEI